MDVLVTGSTGLIGSALVPALAAAGHRPVRLVRTPPGPAGDAIWWDPSAGRIDGASIEGIGAVVHLAGAGIGDGRWTPARKAAILDSRVDGTGLLARTLAGLRRPPATLLSGSAIGYYGDRGDEVLTEQSGRGDGFLADVTVAWEAATEPAVQAAIRVVHLRTGVVLSPGGGALAKLMPLFRLGLGGRLGTGRQWMSWISLDDEVGAIIHLLDQGATGPVNLTAPRPTTNTEFTRTLGRVLHRPAFAAVPRFGPRLVVGAELADALLFSSQRVLPQALEASGYTFRHAGLPEAIGAMTGRAPAPA